MSTLKKHFRLKKPCGNCPFLKEGAIELEPGRLRGIVEHLLNDDRSTFECHKTVHCKAGGDWDDEGNYHASGQEAMCVGAMVHLLAVGRPTVAMRIALATGQITTRALVEMQPMIVDSVR